MAMPEVEQESDFLSTTATDTFLDSTSLQIAAFGGLLWLAALVLQTGVWPALLAIWGTALIVVGVGIYSVVWWTYQ